MTSKSVRQLVESQVKRWSLFEPRKEVTVRWPVVTISRQYGSQGAALGRRIADDLGFDYWDKELVTAIIEESGAWDQLVMSLDEIGRSGLGDLVNNVLMGASGSQAEYLRQLARLIATIDRHGGAVIIGRGAEFLVREDALRVRVVADEEARARRIMERHGGPLDHALKLIHQRDKERRKFIRMHFRADIDDMALYDMVINSTRMPLEVAAGAVVGAYRVRAGGLPKRRGSETAPGGKA